MEELVGVPVMVHPDLTTDPVHMQGIIGTISHVDYEADTVCVKFKNQMLGLYQADALLMLIPAEIVVDKLREEVYEMDIDGSDVVDMLGVYLLDSSKDPESRQQALDWAMGNTISKRTIVFSVQTWIDIQLDRLDMEQAQGRTR